MIISDSVVVVVARPPDSLASAGPQPKTQWRDREGSVDGLCNHIVWMQLSDPSLEGSVLRCQTVMT